MDRQEVGNADGDVCGSRFKVEREKRAGALRDAQGVASAASSPTRLLGCPMPLPCPTSHPSPTPPTCSVWHLSKPSQPQKAQAPAIPNFWAECITAQALSAPASQNPKIVQSISSRCWIKNALLIDSLASAVFKLITVCFCSSILFPHPPRFFAHHPARGPSDVVSDRWRPPLTAVTM